MQYREFGKTGIQVLEKRKLREKVYIATDGRPLSAKLLQELKGHAWVRNFYL